MSELLDQRMTQTGQKQDNKRTGKQTLRLLLSDDEVTEQILLKPKPAPKIILYLRDDVNPADKNFTKHPNEMYDLMASRLTPYECVLYVWLWRISWGYGKNYCKFTRKDALKKTPIKSESSVRRAITGLRDKRFLILVLDDKEKPVLDKSGCLYRVSSPTEIISGKVEEGVPFDQIPIEGVFCVNRVNRNRVILDPDQIEPVQYELTKGVAENRLNMDPQKITSNVIKENDVSAQIEPSHSEHPLKDIKDNLKDSLSQNRVIDLFYNGIGQKKVTKQKRERAESNIRELLNEGFTEKDIAFAVKWTIENSKEKPYDFSLIKETIGQAIAEKEKAEKKEAEKQEREKRLTQEQTEREEQEKLLERIREHKNNLDDSQRKQLREEALDAIKNTKGIREEFVTEILIEAKENEIIRRQLGINATE
jgi:hypothetical protein